MHGIQLDAGRRWMYGTGAGLCVLFSRVWQQPLIRSMMVLDRILLRRILHGLNVCFTILIQVHDRIKKNIMIKLFLFKNDTVALTFERTGI